MAKYHFSSDQLPLVMRCFLTVLNDAPGRETCQSFPYLVTNIQKLAFSALLVWELNSISFSKISRLERTGSLNKSINDNRDMDLSVRGIR